MWRHSWSHRSLDHHKPQIQSKQTSGESWWFHFHSAHMKAIEPWLWEPVGVTPAWSWWSSVWHELQCTWMAERFPALAKAAQWLWMEGLIDHRWGKSVPFCLKCPKDVSETSVHSSLAWFHLNDDQHPQFSSSPLASLDSFLVLWSHSYCFLLWWNLTVWCREAWWFCWAFVLVMTSNWLSAWHLKPANSVFGMPGRIGWNRAAQGP